MPRASRNFPGGLVYHVLNRGVGRRTLFEKDGDFLAFEKVVEETLRTCRMRICAFCILIQPLARRRLAGVGRRSSRLHAANDEHARQTMEGASSRDWVWPFVPGPLQVFSGGNRGLFLPSRPLRRAKCVAREFGGSCRGLALVESEACGTGGSGVSNPLRLAAAQALRLAGTRQPAAIRSRTGCSASSGSPKLPLRQCRLDRRDGETTENRINTTFSGKTEEGKMHATRRDIASPITAYYPNSVAGTFSSSSEMPCARIWWRVPRIGPGRV